MTHAESPVVAVGIHSLKSGRAVLPSCLASDSIKRRRRRFDEQRPGPEAAGPCLYVGPWRVACVVSFTTLDINKLVLFIKTSGTQSKDIPCSAKSGQIGARSQCLCLRCVTVHARACVCVCVRWPVLSSPHQTVAPKSRACLAVGRGQTPGGERIQLEGWRPISNQANQRRNIDRLMGAVRDLMSLCTFCRAVVVYTAPTDHLIAILHNCYFVRPSCSN